MQPKPMLVNEVEPVKEKAKEPLTGEQLLRKENFQLKLQIAQLQRDLNDRNIRLMNIQLQQEKSELDKEFGSDWMK